MATAPLEPGCDCGPEAPPEAGEAIRVLLIDDDRDDYILTRDLLEEIADSRFILNWTTDYSEGLEAICGGTHDVFLLDNHLGARTGLELLREAKARGCTGPVILLTGQGRSRTDIAALHAGADDYLEKAGLTSALLERSIRFALSQFRAAAELERKVKERTEELARANDALREADRRKDVFLATLAHELRNPLAPLRNSLEIIRLAGGDAEAVHRQRERMERQVSQLVRLVDDLLDVSRIATDKLRLALEPLILQEVLEQVLETSRPAIAATGLELQTSIPAEPIAIVGDRVRLTQVFGNLINNAAKFTEQGGITVAASRDGAAARVAITDTGVGIPPDQIHALFDMFTQVAGTLHKTQSGLGIGLALARRLVEMHGGTIEAESDGPGTGTTFTVTLPTRSAD